MSFHLKKRHTDLGGCRNLVLVHLADHLIRRHVPLDASIIVYKKSPCSASGDVLPPRGLAAQLPVAR